jgi:hypothetical protein
VTETADTTETLFLGKDTVVRDTFDRVLATLRDIGPFQVETKKTSIHLTRGVAFAGVHPRKSYLYLNIRLDRPIHSDRIAKSEQVSKHRFHNEVKLSTPEEVDAELVSWLRDAYSLSDTR